MRPITLWGCQKLTTREARKFKWRTNFAINILLVILLVIYVLYKLLLQWNIKKKERRSKGVRIKSINFKKLRIKRNIKKIVRVEFWKGHIGVMCWSVCWGLSCWLVYSVTIRWNWPDLLCLLTALIVVCRWSINVCFLPTYNLVYRVYFDLSWPDADRWGAFIFCVISKSCPDIT